MRYPVEPVNITTEFGVPDSNALFGLHSGLDFATNLNQPIYAPASGELTQVSSKTGGNMVVIFDGTYYHRLMHNNSFVKPEGHVNEGELVAKSGNTGLAFGVHCHWDVNTQGVFPKSFGAFVNPEELIKGGDMATDQQIDDWISKEHQIAFGKPPSDAVFDDWRGVLKNNFTDGSLSILAGIDTNAGALKNQPHGNFVKVTETLYKEK